MNTNPFPSSRKTPRQQAALFGVRQAGVTGSWSAYGLEAHFPVTESLIVCLPQNKFLSVAGWGASKHPAADLLKKES
ncbi:MAG: hypothetical protein IPL58_10515 [Betaproteobacteria bacterium]|uniref:Uncharacterized protein n=1 Tax=Candidatus Proximibacter danicus TaxID=2954365 RepID=A0A9D7K144_9PROT|nr:hypothetical protein [Candidatus Proximibacter danicus]